MENRLQSCARRVTRVSGQVTERVAEWVISSGLLSGAWRTRVSRGLIGLFCFCYGRVGIWLSLSFILYSFFIRMCLMRPLEFDLKL